VGCPALSENFSQGAARTHHQCARNQIGHNSKAVHRAWTKEAQVAIPTLGDFEWILSTASAVAIVPMPAAVA